jgi:hypothetical protein
MRIVAIIITACLFAVSCTQGQNGAGKKNRGKTTPEKAVSFMQEHLKSQVSDAEIAMVADRMITIRGGSRGFVIDPAKVLTGYIDSDELEDVVMPVYSLSGQSLAGYEYLVLLQSPTEFVIAAIMNNVLTVNDISDGIITAEISTVPPDSPGFGCDECRMTVKYRYINGELTEVQ